MSGHYKMVRTAGFNYSNQDTQTIDVECPTGMMPVGGGFKVSGEFPKVLASHPLISAIDSKDGWRVIVQGQSSNQYSVSAYLICAAISAVYDYSV